MGGGQSLNAKQKYIQLLHSPDAERTRCLNVGGWQRYDVCITDQQPASAGAIVVATCARTAIYPRRASVQTLAPTPRSGQTHECGIPRRDSDTNVLYYYRITYGRNITVGQILRRGAVPTPVRGVAVPHSDYDAVTERRCTVDGSDNDGVDGERRGGCSDGGGGAPWRRRRRRCRHHRNLPRCRRRSPGHARVVEKPRGLTRPNPSARPSVPGQRGARKATQAATAVDSGQRPTFARIFPYTRVFRTLYFNRRFHVIKFYQNYIRLFVDTPRR